jgi:hypothetical protein
MSNKPLANWTPSDGIPSIIADHVANSAARLAYSHFPGKTSFDASDVGKVVMQDDDKSTWVCTSIAPLSWFKLASSVQSVANLTELAALLGAGYGQKVRVESVGRSFEFTPTGTSPLQEAVVLNGVGGQWHSLEGTSDQKWLTQVTWYVDNITGNDENAGSALSPIKTTDEIQRRWGINPTLTVRVTIYYINMPDVNILTANRASDTAGVDVIGIPTDLVVTTVGTYAAKVPATNSGNMITSAEVADWTPYLGMRILTNETGVAFVRKVNPDGSGNNKAAVSVSYTSAGLSGTLVVPAAGQTLRIQQLPSCSTLCIILLGGRLNDAAVAGFQPAIYLKHISATKQCILDATGAYTNIKMFGCDLVDLSLLSKGSTSYATACRERYAQGNIPQHYCKGVLFDKSTYAPATQYRLNTSDSWTMEWYHCEWSQIGVQISTVSAIYVSDCQAWDWPTGASAALELADGASIFLLNSFSGSSAAAGTYGFKVRPTTYIHSNNLSGYAAGVSGQIFCVGVGSFLWTDRPLYWAQAKGTDTLVGGTKTVVYKNIPANARIFVTRNTPSGTLGEISVPQAGRTNLGTATSQFIVNSENAGDTSSFDWSFFSPTLGSGGMFDH